VVQNRAQITCILIAVWSAKFCNTLFKSKMDRKYGMSHRHLGAIQVFQRFPLAIFSEHAASANGNWTMGRTSTCTEVTKHSAAWNAATNRFWWMMLMDDGVLLPTDFDGWANRNICSSPIFIECCFIRSKAWALYIIIRAKKGVSMYVLWACVSEIFFKYFIYIFGSL